MTFNGREHVYPLPKEVMEFVQYIRPEIYYGMSSEIGRDLYKVYLEVYMGNLASKLTQRAAEWEEKRSHRGEEEEEEEGEREILKRKGELLECPNVKRQK